MIADPFQVAQGLGENDICLRVTDTRIEPLNMPLARLPVENIKFTFHITDVPGQLFVALLKSLHCGGKGATRVFRQLVQLLNCLKAERHIVPKPLHGKLGNILGHIGYAFHVGFLFTLVFYAIFARFRELALIGFILLLVALISLRNPNFLTFTNFKDILLDISILAMIALAQGMIIITRGIDPAPARSARKSPAHSVSLSRCPV